MSAPTGRQDRSRSSSRSNGDGALEARRDQGVERAEPAFEIGATLRLARRHAGLEPARIETETMIPARFLAAMEEERFGQLPPGPYARSFLRQYAEYLGLNGDVYTAEYDARLAPREPEPAASPPRARRAVLRPGWALAVALAALLGIAAWQLGGSGDEGAFQLVPAATTRTPTPPPAAIAPHRSTAVEASASPAPLTLTAARGDCWLSVAVGSGTGRVVYERTLRQGETIRFGLRKTLWIRVGAPWNLDAAIGRRTVTATLPRSPGDFVVGAAGVRPSS